jgi:hypothetical protein
LRADARGGDGRPVIGVVFGGLGTIVAAIALVPVRDDINNANLALILMLVVVVAAIVGDRRGGAVAAVAATLSFDFFLTRPYLSMRIESADDIETMLILLVAGLLVGEVAERGRRSRRQRDRATEAITRVHRVAERVAHGAPLGEVAPLVIAELKGLLTLRDCWFEVPPFTWSPPRLERAGSIQMSEHAWSRRGFELPEDGVELPILESGQTVGRLILIGEPGIAVTIEERVVAVALADQLGTVLAAASPEERRRQCSRS